MHINTLTLRLSQDQREAVLRRVDHLLESDRALMLALYRDGMSTYGLARLRGSSEAAIRRRAARLIRRVMSAEFNITLARQAAWAQTRRAVARAVVLEGRTIREAARAAAITVHAARRELAHIRGMAEAAQAGGEREAA